MFLILSTVVIMSVFLSLQMVVWNIILLYPHPKAILPSFNSSKVWGVRHSRQSLWGGSSNSIFKNFYFILFYFLERGEGREKERERYINVRLPLMHPLLGTWPATLACALTGSWTSDPLVHRLVLNPLSHTSQGPFFFLNSTIIYWGHAIYMKHYNRLILNRQNVCPPGIYNM